MHDVLEGVLPLEMKLMLGQLLFVEKIFTVAQFQARLDCVDLGYMEVCDKPTPITDAILRATDSSSFKQAGKCVLNCVLYMYMQWACINWVTGLLYRYKHLFLVDNVSISVTCFGC